MTTKGKPYEPVLLTGQTLNFADGKTEQARADISKTVDEMCIYHKPTPEQVEAYGHVASVTAAAIKAIVNTCPPSADRSSAIRHLRMARMEANSAIAHNGRF